MKKWHVTASRALFVAGMLVLSSPLSANQETCASANQELCALRCGCGIEASVEFLYLKPYVDDLDYVWKSKEGIVNFGTDTADGKGRYNYVHLDWEPAYRGSLLMRDLWCGINMGASYTYLEASDSHSTSAEGTEALFPTISHGGFDISNINHARGKWGLTFQTGDILLSYDFCCEGGHRVTPAVGATIVVLDQDIKARYQSDLTGDEALYNWKSGYTGYGLKAGADYNYKLTECFDLYAKAYCSLVTGDSDEDVKIARTLNTSGPTDLTDLKLKSHECLFVPGYQLAVGVLFHECWCGIDVGMRLGWEFMAWHGVANPGRFTDDGIRIGTGSSRSTTTLGFQGLSAGLQARF
ncbi:Lpg1974 family pore-forming outer membrane protein [Estrella lausannensis]|uniref:Outer membrane protein n=1 Tax=Estrella lausannensis TaxID=483423 RepID=A0A0H5E5Y0_9BACT|nr:Lpg1974 family pore-forming outer membrane protein [Estrella lausannensis]CRX38640.1 Outer membrane protein [Estrella lausannensis]